MALDTELRVYQAKLPEWQEHEGKWVLIKGEVVAAFFSAYEDAIKAGYEKFGLEPFLVKRVQVVEQIQSITRLTQPAVV